MRMKKYMLLMATLVLTSCSNQLIVDGEASEDAVQNPPREINALKEKARWGDSEAYVKLADCYRDGKGVQKDFIGMLTMLSLANDYSEINQMEGYLDRLPENSEYKIIIDCLQKLDQEQTDEPQMSIERLKTSGSPDGYTIEGVYVQEHGDSIEARRLFEIAAEKGSSLAELLLCVPDWRGAEHSNVEELAKLTDKIPWASIILAGIYKSSDDNSADNDMAAYYYLKADKHACLTKNGARWLLRYHRNGGNLHLNASDIERLQILANKD